MWRSRMNWKLIFGLSLFGFAMAFATVFIISATLEPFFWLVIFIVVALVIARSRPDRAFVHGLLVGIVNSVWITCAHIVLFDQYIAKHPKDAAMMKSMPMQVSPRVMMAVVGPIIGVITGAVIGVLAYLAVKLFKTRTSSASA